jgi:hypothetical protein
LASDADFRDEFRAAPVEVLAAYGLEHSTLNDLADLLDEELAARPELDQRMGRAALFSALAADLEAGDGVTG